MSYIESNIAGKPSTILNWHQGWDAIATSRLWFFLLMGLGTMSNVVYTCNVPLVGFGAIAGATLPRRRALITVLSMWLVNQGLGFTIRRYPWTLTTVAWGPVLALGAILVMLLASVKPQFSQQGLAGYGSWLATSLVAGFGVYELGIWLACLVLGGCDSFTLPILWGIFQGNATWAIVLIGIHCVLVWQTLQQSKRQANGI